MLSPAVPERFPVYRAPMRARDLELPAGAGAEYGLACGVVAIGRGEGDRGARMLHRFALVVEGAFVWTRDRAGGYYLGRIAGPLRDDRSAAARALGIAHVRAAEWLASALGESEVPPAVAKTFARGGRNFQRVYGEEAERSTAEIWLRLRGG
jgi:hypothetical protein